MIFTAEVDKLAPALVKALGALVEPTKSGKAEVRGRNSYTYMTLPDLLAAVRTAFTPNGLAALQTHTYEDGAVGVVTWIIHDSGQWLTTPPLHIRCQPDAQAIGSAATYGKRYQLAALVGLAGGDDDDGRRAAPAPDSRPAPPVDFTRGSITQGSATDKSRKAMWALLRQTKMDDYSIRGWVSEVLGVGLDWHTATLSQQQVSTIIDRLKETAPPREATGPGDATHQQEE